MSGNTAQIYFPIQEQCIAQMFIQRVDELGDRSFIKLRQGPRFEEPSWRKLSAIVRHVVLAVADLGCDTVAVRK